MESEPAEDSQHESLALPNPLPDVIADEKKRLSIEALMSPVVVETDIPTRLLDHHFNQQIFADPVFTDAGDTYEREAIMRWLEDHDTNPIDNEVLRSKELRSDKRTLREVNEFLDQNPALRNSEELYLPREWVKELEMACRCSGTASIKRLVDRDRRLLSWTFNFEGEKYDSWRGKTMLHLACETGTTEAVMQLLDLAEKRAEGLALMLLLKKDSLGKWPIHYAMQPSRDPCLMRFIAARMGKRLLEVEPVPVRTPEGQKPRQITALHLAATNNHANLVEKLLGQKADLSVKDHQGQTPLHLAVACGAIETIPLLIFAGASADVENDQRQTPQMVGQLCKQSQAVAVLQSSIAKIVKAQQGQLQDAGPMGLALMQVQQLLEQMQIIVRSQGSELMEELLEFKEQQTQMMEELSAKVERQRAALHFSRKQLDQLASEHAELTSWEPWEILSQTAPITPAALRKRFIDDFHLHPLAKQVSLYSVEVKGYEIGQNCILSDKDDMHSDVRALAVFPDGRIASACTAGKIKIWDMNKSVCTMKVRHDASLNGLTVLNDGKLVSGSDDRSIKIWDEKGAPTFTLSGHSNYVCALGILSSGRFFSGSRDQLINIWNPTNGECIHTFSHEGSIGYTMASTIALPNDQIASCGDDKTIKIWNASGALVATLTGHREGVNVLAAFGENGLVSGSNDKTIRIWDLKSHSHSFTLSGQENSVIALAVISSRLVSSDKEEMKVWDLEQRICLFTLNDNATSLLSLPHSSLVISGHEDGEVKVWTLGKLVELDMDFLPALQMADAQLHRKETNLFVKTCIPCEGALKAMSIALQKLFPEYTFNTTLTADELTFVDPPGKLLGELETLCEMFGASKLTSALHPKAKRSKKILSTSPESPRRVKKLQQHERKERSKSPLKLKEQT